MTGEPLLRLLRSALHHDTFELFVAPAIADLQHSPSPGAHIAVWRSFVAAVGQDMVADAQLLVDDVGLMLGLIAIQVCYYGGMLLLLVADVRADQMISRLTEGAASVVMLTLAGVVMASSIPTLLCFWPPRRTLDA